MPAFYCVCASSAPASVKHFRGRRVINNAVRITATMPEGQRRPGFGFIVGGAGGFLYIVTANHVVRDYLPGGVAQELRVEMRGVASALKGELLSTHEDKPIDLAVLRVPTPDGFRWERACYPIRPVFLNDRISYVGRDREWFVPSSQGTVLRSSGPSTAIIARFSSADAPNVGTSGSPAFNESGILGMIVSIDSKGTTGITPIQEIKRLFDKTPLFEGCWKLVRALRWPPSELRDHSFEQFKHFLSQEGRLVLATDFRSGPEPFTEYNGAEDKVFTRNHYLVYNRNHDDCSGTGWYVPNLEVENFYVHVTARMVAGDLNSNPGFGLILKHTDIENDYSVGAPMPAGPKSKDPRPNGCIPGGDNGYFVLFRFIKGVQTKTRINATVELNVTYDIFVKFIDGWLTVFVDGKKVYEGQELGLRRGEIGLAVGGIGKGEFTNFVVVDADQEPETPASEPKPQER